jgi:hypothetical protein
MVILTMQKSVGFCMGRNGQKLLREVVAVCGFREAPPIEVFCIALSARVYRSMPGRGTGLCGKLLMVERGRCTLRLGRTIELVFGTGGPPAFYSSVAYPEICAALTPAERMQKPKKTAASCHILGSESRSGAPAVCSTMGDPSRLPEVGLRQEPLSRSADRSLTRTLAPRGAPLSSGPRPPHLSESRTPCWRVPQHLLQLIGTRRSCTATVRQQIVRYILVSGRLPLMTTRFESYGRTALGRRLAAIISTPGRYVEYRAFSREGFPAITALVSVVGPEIEPLRRSDRQEFDAAK